MDSIWLLIFFTMLSVLEDTAVIFLMFLTTTAEEMGELRSITTAPWARAATPEKRAKLENFIVAFGMEALRPLETRAGLVL